MKKTVYTIVLIAIAVLVLIAPSDYFVSSTYRTHIESVFSSIPVPSTDGHCVRSLYKKEIYFFVGPPFVMEPYSGQTGLEKCFFSAQGSPQEAGNSLAQSLISAGWTYEKNRFDANDDYAHFLSTQTCNGGEFSRGRDTLTISRGSNCVSFNSLLSSVRNQQELTQVLFNLQNRDHIDSEFTLYYHLSDSERNYLQLLSSIIFVIKLIILIGIVIAIISVLQRKF
jgi:hypothetical protein